MAELALIHGLGRFGGGVAAARCLAAEGLRLRIADRAPAIDLDASRDQLDGIPDIDWRLGEEQTSLLDGVDLMVVNPAVPDSHPLLRAAATRGIRRTQEVNLFLERFPGRVVAVTGTNGKSSTCQLLHQALRRSGQDSLLGGNIGRSLLEDAASWHPAQLAVLEVSSFQLDRIDPARHRVHGAVFTPVTQDHLDRHGSLTAYRRAKARLALAARDFCLLPAGDPICAAMPVPDAARLTYSAVTDVDAEGFLRAPPGGPRPRLLHRDALRLLGAFQIDNACAAAQAALRCGADAHRVGLGLATSRPLPHRLHELGSIRGRRLVDNAISTQMATTLNAMDSLPAPIHWVGGGQSKDGDHESFLPRLRQSCASAHLFGAAAGPLSAALAGQLPCTAHLDLQQALDAALDQAAAGEFVLFSPGFASYDQFANFKARALAFHAWIADARPQL